MRKRKLTLAVALLLTVFSLSSCHRDVAESSGPLGQDATLTVNGEEHSYVKYEESDGILFTPKLPQSEYTCGEPILQGESYSYFEAQEATLGEAVVKKYAETGEEETLVVCRFANFETVEDILNFFNITSPESISSVDVYTLNYNDGDSYGSYRLYGTFDTVGGEVYDLLATMEKDFTAKIGGSLTGSVGSDTTSYKAWADSVIKLDVTLSSGIVLPVFCAGTTDYIGILDTVTNFSGHPDEGAVNRLREAVGL